MIPTPQPPERGGAEGRNTRNLLCASVQRTVEFNGHLPAPSVQFSLSAVLPSMNAETRNHADHAESPSAPSAFPRLRDLALTRPFNSPRLLYSLCLPLSARWGRLCWGCRIRRGGCVLLSHRTLKASAGLLRQSPYSDIIDCNMCVIHSQANCTSWK